MRLSLIVPSFPFRPSVTFLKGLTKLFLAFERRFDRDSKVLQFLYANPIIRYELIEYLEIIIEILGKNRGSRLSSPTVRHIYARVALRSAARLLIRLAYLPGFAEADPMVYYPDEEDGRRS